MSGVIKVEASLFPSISSFYEGQRGDLLKAKSYVQEHCTLSDSFGLLLSLLKTPYEDARDKVFGAFGSIADTIDALAHQVEGYVQDVAATTNSIQLQIDAINQQLLALQAQHAPSGQPGGGGGGGGYGGGIPSVPSPVIPQPVTPQPVAPSPAGGGDTYIFNGSGPVYVETGPGDLVVGDDAADHAGGPDDHDAPAHAPAAEAQAASVGSGGAARVGDQVPAGPAQGGAQTAPPAPPTAPAVGAAIGGVAGDPGQHLPLTPEQESKYADLYKQVWQDEAAHDPLGRSAEQLQAAWEAREPVKPESGAQVGFGYAQEKGAAAPSSINLTLLGIGGSR